MRRLIAGLTGLMGFAGLLLGLAGPVAADGAADGGCPRSMVAVGPTCIDKFEASVWQTTDPRLIRAIRSGDVTVAQLQAGATQRGLAFFNDLAANGCPTTGNGCTNVYAVSIKGVQPARVITWFQASAAARNAGKRLPTNAEWQAAALGTPDPGATPGAVDCNTNSTNIDPTGSRANCKSDVGAFDMVGNLAEWVADWVPLSELCLGWLGFSDDMMCLGGASVTFGPGALFRGGAFFDSTKAGVFAVGGEVRPTDEGADFIGFRAAR